MVMKINQFTDEIILLFNQRPDKLLQMLIKIQRQYSYIPQQAITQLSRKLLLTEANILSVIGFYSFLHKKSRGSYDLRISDNITDQMLGSTAITSMFSNKLSVQLAIPRKDGRVCVDSTSCIGMSDQGPAMLVNGMPVVSLNKKRVESICQLIESNSPLNQWPKSFFHIKNNIQRKDILLTDCSDNGAAISALINQGSQNIHQQIEHSNLRGRGGAGFHTSLKWRSCKDAIAKRRYVVCNADEGEPGTFKDRVLLTTQPDKVIEGMTLCAGIIGNEIDNNGRLENSDQLTGGFIYLRGEYEYLYKSLQRVLQRRRDAGLLGKNILGVKGFDFDIEIHLGAGAYICGEESALIESLEGKRGIPRNRPPFPAIKGYNNQPTVVNNVETFVNATLIAIHGACWFKKIGTAQSRGSKLLSISGDCDRPGVYEFPFGTSIRHILDDCGAQNVQAVQVSGPAGFTIPAQDFDRYIGFEDVPAGGSFMIFNQQRNLLDMVKNFGEFFVNESCGFCTPCRVGCSLLMQMIDRVHQKISTNHELCEIKKLSHLMIQTSHCGLGSSASNSVMDTLKYFPKLYQQQLNHSDDESLFDLQGELLQARQLTGDDNV